MKVEVLVSTLNKDPKDLIKKMNIQSDAIIVCQCDKNEFEEIIYNEQVIRIYYFAERGVGLSRNTALMRAKGDILVFADDDEVFVDGYEKMIINEYLENKKAEMIMFNISTNSLERNPKKNLNIKKIKTYNCLRYGTPRITIKNKVVRKKNIYFSLMFGPGTNYGCGEDSLFIYNLIKSKVKAYTTNKVLCDIDMSESSWFNGYNEKYFYDKGALFRALYHNNYFPYALFFILKHRNMYKELGFRRSLKMMINGAVDFEKNI